MSDQEGSIISLMSSEARRALNNINQSPSSRISHLPPSLETPCHQGLREGIREGAITLRDDTVEELLANLGYISNAKIIVRDSDGHEEARYIEASTKLGQKVYIQLDVKGYVRVNPNDLTMFESKKASVVPYSVKMGAFECAGMDTCGIAFTCDNNVCVLTRDNDATIPEETNFTFMEKSQEPAVAILGSSAIPYPIVRLSEIQANPDLVLKIVDDATRRIRNASYASCNDDLEKTADALRNVNTDFAEFDEIYSKTANDLAETINEFQDLNFQYLDEGSLQVEDPDIQEENKRKYDIIVYNLRKRHEYMTELLRICSFIGETRNSLALISEKIQGATRYIQEKFPNLQEDLTD